MTHPVIQVEGLSKRYTLGATRSLVSRISDAVRGSSQGAAATRPEAFWAVRDVSFDVGRGEIVGVIGHNGAGKSTLLKILSRITEPTSGHAAIRGRVASLLEVGTGFHPELTGRENVFLSGALLGMKAAEIRAAFDAIVEFAEVGKFLDTPVKRYSSGMYVRLAFAVAAHLKPEVLLVDEVLAVGDAAFQRKCLGKMSDVAQGGRTVLFVSHNMAAVANLCSRCLLLHKGEVAYFGDTEEAVRRYLHHAPGERQTDLRTRDDRGGTGDVRITAIDIASASEDTHAIRSGDRLRVVLSYASDRPLRRPRFLVGIYDHLNLPLFRLDTQVTEQLPEVLPATGQIVCHTGPLLATAGPCFFNVAAQLGEVLADHVTQAASINIEPADLFATGRSFDRRDSLFILEQSWEPHAAAA